MLYSEIESKGDQKMEHLGKWFGGRHISWKEVILFAVGAGAYTGLINQVPFLQNTSFTDIAVTYEVWMLFAILIAVNCEKPLESACKVFVFFLISQPLCFLVEVPSIGMDKAVYYLSTWMKQILLTFPGGFAAYYAKKDNWLGALICAAGAGFESIFLVTYCASCYFGFPRHFLTILVCLFVIFVFMFVLERKKWFRILTGCVIIVVCAFFTWQLTHVTSVVSYPLNGTYTESTLKVKDGSTVVIDPSDNTFSFSYNPLTVSSNTITFTNFKGDTKVFQVVVFQHKVDLQEVK